MSIKHRRCIVCRKPLWHGYDTRFDFLDNPLCKECCSEAVQRSDETLVFKASAEDVEAIDAAFADEIAGKKR